MAGQESFFSTSVGARRGVPPLRLERCHSARTCQPLPSSVASQHDVVTVKRDLDMMQEKALHPLGSSFSETSCHASRSTAGSSSDDFPAVLNPLEHKQPLLSLEPQNTSVKATKSTVVKEKSSSVKTANGGKRKIKKLEAEKMEETEKTDFPPLLLDSFKTKAVLAKRVSQVLTPSERIGSNLTPYSYLIRIPPRFPHGRHSYSVLPYILHCNSKPGNPESRVVVISKLLQCKHLLWAMAQSASSSVKAACLTHHSHLSTHQGMGWPRISPAGMKIINEFHLQDVLRKQEERVRIEGAHHRIQKQHLRKISKKVKAPVRYKEATQLCGLEEQLQCQRKSQANHPLPSEQDLARYEEYLQRIQHHQVTTPPSNLLKVVTLDVDKMVLRNIRFRLVVSELVEELSECYLQGVRHAILRYALLSPAMRARLNIIVAPEEHKPFVVRAPVPWHQNFITGAHHCYHNLFALNHVLGALDTMWEERFSTLRFVDMRLLVGGQDEPVLTPQALEAAVRSQCLQTRTVLLQKWLPGVAHIFEELIGAWRELVPTEAGDSLRQVRRFFSAVRSRMSLQLRSLVLASITDFRDCLLRHKAGNSYSGDYIEEKYIEKAVVEVSVAVENHRVSFQPPLQKTHECLLGCLASIIEHNQCIPRIERLLFPEMSRRKLYLQAVSEGEEAVKEVWSEVSKVFAANAAGPSTYISLYNQYTHLLDGSTCTAVQDFISNCGVLKEGKKLLANLQQLGGEAVQLRDMVPLALILLNCRQINQQLQQQVQELTTAILDYFVIRNKEHDKDVCRSFDDMSTKLSQVTDVTAEIVDLSNYLHICSSQTMTQLLQEIQNATDRLLFLLQFGKVPEDQVQLINRMYAWPHKIQEDFRLAEARLSHKRDLKETALKTRVANFEKTLQIHHKELEDLRSRDNFIMKEIRVDTMKRNVETLDHLTIQLQEAMKELQAGPGSLPLQ